MSPSHSFHSPEEFEPVWKRFTKIAKREGKSAGILIRDFITRYVGVHEPGNPQTRITSYVEGGPIELAIIEGRIREHFRHLNVEGRDVRWREIIDLCKGRIQNNKTALSIAKRVDAWLRKRGVKVWR